MAISITVAELAAAIRAGGTALETAEITRLREYAIEAITRHLGASYVDAPETAVNEASVRLVGYVYDKPTSARGAAWANAGRNSGAWSTLLPYVIHRAGGVAEATAAAQAAVGSADNPVIEVTVDAGAGTITVSFADGTTRTDTLPAGMGGAGQDQDARDAAAAAQATADAAQSTATANANKLMPPSLTEAQNGTATAIRGWTSALVRANVDAALPPAPGPATTTTRGLVRAVMAGESLSSMGTEFLAWSVDRLLAFVTANAPTAGGGGTPTVQVDEVPMTGGTFGTLGAGRTFRMPYPTGTTRASYQGKVVDAHVFAAVTGHFMQGSRVLTLSGAALWLSEGTTGSQWNVILQDDGIRLFIPFAVDAVAITSATVYLARLT